MSKLEILAFPRISQASYESDKKVKEDSTYSFVTSKFYWLKFKNDSLFMLCHIVKGVETLILINIERNVVIYICASVFHPCDIWVLQHVLLMSYSSKLVIVNLSVEISCYLIQKNTSKDRVLVLDN